MLPSAVALLPAPNAGDAKQGYVTREAHEARAKAKRAANPNLGDLHANLSLVAQTTQNWGDYAPAIARWEQILGRPAPEPTRANSKGNPQLSAHFVEWLMGLDAGWVTDTPGITRNEALKALGNGVVPQQAEAALRFLLPRMPTGK